MYCRRRTAISDEGADRRRDSSIDYHRSQLDRVTEEMSWSPAARLHMVALLVLRYNLTVTPVVIPWRIEVQSVYGFPESAA